VLTTGCSQSGGADPAPELRAEAANPPGGARSAAKTPAMKTQAAKTPAAEQGKFWEYQAALFAHPDALDRASLERHAEDLGLDDRRFRAALDDPRLDALVAADDAEADRLHVKGTPTFFVNGRRVIGAQPLAKLRAPVDEALAQR